MDVDENTSPMRATLDGKDILLQVDVLPAKFPAIFTQASSTRGDDFLIALYYLVGGAIARLFDRRWKVVTSTRRIARFSRCRIVETELYDTLQDAERRRTQLRGRVSTGVLLPHSGEG